MRDISNRLARLLFRRDRNEEKIKLYEFSIYVLFSSIIHIGSIFVIGLFFNMIYESLILYFSFITIRKFAGGYHAKTPVICYLVSITIIITSLLLLKSLTKHNLTDQLYYLFISFALLALIILVVISPLDNKNKTLNSKEKKVYKLISIIISTILFLISLSIFNLNEQYSIAILIGIILNGITLLIGKIQSFVSKQL